MSKMIRRTAISVAAAAVIATPVMFAVWNSGQLAQQTGTGYRSQQVPLPVSTAALQVAPSVTPEPPAPEAPLPAPPVATTLARNPNMSANIAWGVEGTDSLTVWVGAYDTKASGMSISNSQPVVRWDKPLQLVDLEASPDRKSLAVLTVDSTYQPESGVTPVWLSVIDLTTHSVRSIPDYGKADLYEYYFYRPPTEILGWLDNDRVALQQSGEGPVVATKDGATYSRVPVPGNGVAAQTALSPDHSTFFSEVAGGDGGYWLYNTDGGNPRKVLGTDQARQVYSPVWSPDGKRIAFVSPKTETVDGTKFNNQSRLGIWVLDLASKTQQAISGDSGWDVGPAWSADGSTVAFLRADAPEANPIHYAYPDKTQTGVFTANVNNPAPVKVATDDSVGKRHRDVAWAPSGELLVSSVANGTNSGRGLVAVSPGNSKSATLVGTPANQSVVRATIFK